MNQSITPTWLARSALLVAPDLIGCTLVRQWPDGQIGKGIIVETEAYTPDDPACHGYRRQTPRNAVMFGPAGMSYVYLIYGMYHCFNVVTDVDGVASAVLIRALQIDVLPPDKQLDTARSLAKLAAGPGKLCRLFEIDRSLTALPLKPGSALWLEHRTSEFQQALDIGHTTLVQTTRIGLTQGADRPWRWYIAHHPAVSKLA